MSRDRICFIADVHDDAQSALHDLLQVYDHVPLADADIVIVLGGDGFMLQMMHRLTGSGKHLYGMNCGSVGFLMNVYRLDNLEVRLRDAEATNIHPLRMEAVDMSGVSHEALAFNEVSLLRRTHQVAKLRVLVDGHARLDALLCDGILVATPAGSTAYNLSAHGPILPIGSQLLALTPISAFRPRRWRGAVLPWDAHISIEILSSDRRPVSAVADRTEFHDMCRVDIRIARSVSAHLLFDSGHSFEERVLREQFVY